MTFLDLCKRLRQEAAITGTGPATVVTQTGEMKRVVDWVNAAWTDIQNLHEDWLWMRASFSGVTVIGTAGYTAATWTATDFARWWEKSFRCYTTVIGVSDEQKLVYLPYADFRDRYEFGSQTNSRPRHFTVRPDQSISLGPAPDAVYTVRGEYQKCATEMTANADVPGLPSQSHLMLVWAGLQLYAGYESAPEAHYRGKEEYDKLLPALERSQLTRIRFGGALA